MSHVARVWNAVIPDQAPLWKIRTEDDLVREQEDDLKLKAILQGRLNAVTHAADTAPSPEDEATQIGLEKELERQLGEVTARINRRGRSLSGGADGRAKAEKKKQADADRRQDQHTIAAVVAAAANATTLRKCLEPLVPAYAAHVKTSDAAFADIAANPRLKQRFMPHSLKAAYSLELSRIAATRPDMNWAFPIVPPSGDQGFIQGIDNTKTPPIDALYIEMVTQVRAELEEAEKARDKDPA
jgi:hypothetical protein